MNVSHSARPQQERADQSRTRILEAAIRIFSEHGLAGARTEQIARAAEVNKALLYYYFPGKEALYEAALDLVAGRVLANSMAILSQDCSPGERVVCFALQHFDRMHSQQGFQGLLHQEMMRMHKGEKNVWSGLAEKVFKPSTLRLLELVAEGQRNGELIDVDPWQMMYGALGANTFFFLSMPVVARVSGRDLLTPDELQHRRTKAVEYLGTTIFVDRTEGASVVRRVLETHPMPPVGDLSRWKRLAIHEVKQK